MGSSYSFHDVFGMDVELLAMVPQPVIALLLLFPCSAAQSEHKDAQQEQQEASGFVANPKSFFLKQTIGNACGTIGLIHAIANNLDVIELGPGFLKEFIDSCKELSPEDRGEKLEENKGITEEHESAAREGQTEADSEDENVNLHFICFTNVEQRLYEFDGTKAGPVDHGARYTFFRACTPVPTQLYVVFLTLSFKLKLLDYPAKNFFGYAPTCALCVISNTHNMHPQPSTTPQPSTIRVELYAYDFQLSTTPETPTHRPTAGRPLSFWMPWPLLNSLWHATPRICGLRLSRWRRHRKQMNKFY